MRMLIVVVTLIAAPLVVVAPAAAAVADRPASGDHDAPIMISGSARQDLTNHSIASLPPQAREAATTQHAAASESGGDTAVLPRHYRDDAQIVSECAEAPAAPVAPASAGGASARGPPASD